MTKENQNIPNYDLLAKFFAGECSRIERKTVDDWRTASSENKKTFDSMYFLWANTNRTIQAKNIDENKAWEKFQSNLSTQKQAKTLKFSFNRQNLLGIAAVLVVGILIAVIYKFQFAKAEILMAVAENEIQEISLHDSSKVTLNKASQLEYPEEFEGNTRKVKLKGEAYFKIAHNAEKQFIIETKYAEIRVIGTEFNVQAYDSLETTVITVNQGVVELRAFSDTGKVLRLIKGEVGIIDNKTGAILKQEADNITIDYWRTKILKFYNTRLDVVILTLTEIYKIDFKFTNEKIKNCELNFEFPEMPIEDLLNVISVTFDLKFIKKDNIYLIEGEGC